MAPNASRTKLIAEVLDDYVEERVRHFPGERFDLVAVKRAIGQTLRDGNSGIELTSIDDPMMVQWLERHPFLVAADRASKLSWKPGLNKGRVQGR